MLREHHGKSSDNIGIFLKNVQSGVTGDARTRTSCGDSVECGVLAWSAANDPDAYQGMEVGLEAEMGFTMNVDYSLPMNATTLVGSVMANLCGSHYPSYMALVEESSQRVLMDKE